MIDLGALTSGVIATVDEHGSVRRNDAVIEWRVRTDEWIVPSDVRARQTRVDIAPIAETAIRVPGGEAVQRAYALGDAARTVVIEVENASPDAIAVGFVVPEGVVCSWAPKPARTEPDGLVVFPVPHRTRVRCAIADAPVDAATLADVDGVVRAWDRVLDRGMRTELPVDLQAQVDRARVDALLAPPSAAAFVALEDWGFDDEAASMWARLGMRERRSARRRAVETGVLGATRAALIADDTRGVIDLFPGFRTEWLGQNLAAHDIPLRRGRCSFAVRWHGARPALLWDVPSGVRLRTPVLDPGFESREPVGETLLAEPQGALLAMGSAAREHGAEGTKIDEPESFS